MFEKVNVPILGVVENMSYLDDGNGKYTALFGEGGGLLLTAESTQSPSPRSNSLDVNIRKGCDLGIPIVLKNSDAKASQSFIEIADRLIDQSVQK